VVFISSMTRHSPLKSKTRKIAVRFAFDTPDARVRIRRGALGKTRPKRAFVIDPCPASRRALAQALNLTPDLVLCGEADSPLHSLRAIERLEPDVVVTEILCHQNLAFIRHLKHRYPRLPILVFSFLDEAGHAPQVLEAGADGYVSKFSSMPEVLEGIRAIVQGRLVLSSRMRAQFLAKCLPPSRPFPPRATRSRPVPA
jgi:DNA-binding NarL/FixJ family response regulator